MLVWGIVPRRLAGWLLPDGFLHVAGSAAAVGQAYLTLEQHLVAQQWRKDKTGLLSEVWNGTLLVWMLPLP